MYQDYIENYDSKGIPKSKINDYYNKIVLKP